MKLLILCLLGVLLMTTGTIVCEGTLKGICQTGFMVVAGFSGFLLLAGHFN